LLVIIWVQFTTLCQKGLLLNNGMLVYNSNINDVLSKYATLNISQINKLESIKFRGPLKDKIHFTSIFLNEYNPFEEFIHIKPQDDWEFCISLDLKKNSL